MSTAILSHGEHAGHVKAPPGNLQIWHDYVPALGGDVVSGLIGGYMFSPFTRRTLAARQPGHDREYVRSSGPQLSVSQRRIGHQERQIGSPLCHDRGGVNFLSVQAWEWNHPSP